MDIEKLSRGEKIAGISAVALFIFMFFDWFTVSVSGAGGAFSTGALGAGSAWDALDNIPIFLVLTILVVLAGWGCASATPASSRRSTPTWSLQSSAPSRCC